MARTKVLHFTEVINKYDFIDVIIRFADQRYFEMQAATYSKESNIEDPEYTNLTIPHYSLNIKWGYIGFLTGIWKLSSLIRKQRIEILHTHHYYEAVMGSIACWFYPACHHVVGRHYHNDLYLTTKGLKLRLYLFIENRVNKYSKAIISPSTLINELLAEQGVAAKKIKFAPYGFDFHAPRYKQMNPREKDELKEKLGLSGKFLIGNFSRHHPIKGQMDLLSAFRSFVVKYPNARLVMVGDGPYRKVLEKYVADNDLKDLVIFLGWRKDGHALMNAMNIIVHSSLQEAFPQTMIEVMALGIPLLICPVSGATDVVQHQVNGIIIPFHSAEVIEKYLELMYKDRQQAQEIGRQARVRAFTYDIKNVISVYENIYKEITHQQ